MAEAEALPTKVVHVGTRKSKVTKSKNCKSQYFLKAYFPIGQKYFDRCLGDGSGIAQLEAGLPTVPRVLGLNLCAYLCQRQKFESPLAF
jgi:hypothetical protein